jgi:hypothetical protein
VPVADAPPLLGRGGTETLDEEVGRPVHVAVHHRGALAYQCPVQDHDQQMIGPLQKGPGAGGTDGFV